tara:strand:- start:1105 stop:2022 length:918 start_codon:yes stop_codon:yes gene_type:complete
MKVAIFGGSGFVGNYLIDELLENKHKVVSLVRFGNEHKITNSNKIKIITGDIDNPTAIEQTMMNAEAVIYNIGIIKESKFSGITFEKLHFEGLKKCVDMAEKLNIKRFILMSANGVKESGTDYQTTKYRSEQYLENSKLDWTIFRPSLIFGNSIDKKEFCKELKDEMLSLPFPAPLFFDGIKFWNAGKFKMSPIHVTDVSKIFIKSLLMNETIKNIYHLGGKTLDWKTITREIAVASNKETKIFIPAPAMVVKTLAFFFGPLLPISRDQIVMLMEGNTCDSSEVFNLFDIRDPLLFNQDNLKYLR